MNRVTLYISSVLKVRKDYEHGQSRRQCSPECSQCRHVNHWPRCHQ